MPDQVTAGTARPCFFRVEVVTVTQQHHQPAPTAQHGPPRRNGRADIALGQAGVGADLNRNLNAGLGQRGQRMPVRASTPAAEPGRP